MMLPFVIGLLMAAVGLRAQSTCISTIPAQSGTPTLYYEPFVPPQIPPVSTVWNHMVYETFFAVDCRYVTVEKIDNNQPQTGFYNAITTSDILTLTRVACIQETAEITRRDRGQAMETHQPRATGALKLLDHQKRDTNQASVLAIANNMAADLPPDVQGLSLRAFQYLIQVNTALFALNLYNTGFDMTATCAVLQDPVTAARLYVASIDPVQAANIICYAAQHGLYLDRSNSQLLSDLLAVIYSIEVKSGFTNNTTEICQTVDLTSLGYLGVDENGIKSYLCDTSTSTALASSTTANVTATSYTGTGGPVTLGTAGTGSPVIATNGPIAPYPNSTVSGTGSDEGSLAWGSGYGATGAATAGSASETFNVTFPYPTGNTNSSDSSGGHIPPSPASLQHYAVWTTSTTPTPRMPRY